MGFCPALVLSRERCGWQRSCPALNCSPSLGHIQAAFLSLRQVNVIHTANPAEHASHMAAQPQFVHPEHRSFVDLSGHNLASPRPFAGRSGLLQARPPLATAGRLCQSVSLNYGSHPWPQGSMWPDPDEAWAERLSDFFLFAEARTELSASVQRRQGHDSPLAESLSSQPVVS